jgi:Ca2+/Na+ antiporter
MFTPPPTEITNSLTGNEFKIFNAITEDIKENSGLKKPKLWIEVLLFLFVVIVGYTVAFFLVKANLTVLGGMMIFITSLFVYFVYMGYKALQGTQIDRVTSFLNKHSEMFTTKVKGINYQFVYSFNNCKYLKETSWSFPVFGLFSILILTVFSYPCEGKQTLLLE